MSREEKHLDIEQIERLIGARTDEGASFEESDLLEQARFHLANCESCQRVVSMGNQADQLLRGLKREAPAEATSDCPPETTLCELALGTQGEEAAGKLLSHVAGCDRCGPMLRENIKIFRSSPTPEEEAVFASLRTSQSEWQEEMARRLASVATDSQRPAVAVLPAVRNTRRAGYRIGWVYSLAAATALLVLVGGIVWRSREPSVERLLAQAYAERRTLELRIPGAPYAPPRITRGAHKSSVDRPASLLAAENAIKKGLTAEAGSPQWLQAKARFDVLDGNPDSAIESLQRALEVNPDSALLLADLATAYFERAVAAPQPLDYGLSFESLSQALAKTPDDPVPIFNRAIVSEHLFLYAQAVDDWEHYLRVDGRGEWAEEARSHLSNVRRVVQDHGKKLAEPLLDPSRIANLTPGSADFSPLDARLEEYLRVAIVRWVPEAFSSPAVLPAKKENLRKAIGVVAGIAKTKHNDPWLFDLISRPITPTFASAAAALSTAIESSERGDYDSARKNAGEARRLFRVSGNVAGDLRARVEDIYALHLSHEGQKCMQSVAASEDEIARSNYRWLQIQFDLEQAICKTIMGSVGAAKPLLLRAIDVSQLAGYNSIHLRALGVASDIDSGAGNVKSGWDRAYSGLELYWSGVYPGMLGYNLYSDLDTAADVMHLPYVQVALWRQALEVLGPDPDLLLQAMAHSWMANAAYAAGMLGVAEREFAEANRLFGMAPQTEATRNDKIEAETWLAQLEGMRGDVDAGLTRLKGIEPVVAQVSNHYLGIRFYAAMAQLAIHHDASTEGERAARVAVLLSEHSLRSLETEDDRLNWNRETANSYRALVQSHLRHGDPQAALEIWEWYRGASVRARQDEGKPHEKVTPLELGEDASLPVLVKVASRLPELTGTTVVAYGQFRDGIAVWVYDNRGIYEHWIPIAQSDVNRLVKRFRGLCASPNTDLAALRQDGRHLYELLITPIEGHLSPGRTLVIEAEETLATLPMTALIDHSGRYLAARGPIVFSPGIYYWGADQDNSHVTSGMTALVVGVAAPKASSHAHVFPVSDAVEEAVSVAKDFPAATLLRDSEATLEAIERDLVTVSVFHFAGHTINSNEGIGLAVADTDYGNSKPLLLSAGRIERLDIRQMRLAVLSACETQDEMRVEYSDASGLADAFLRAGVPHVIASRWDVDSRVTASLMHSFYQNLRGGRSAPDSMQAAQRAIREVPETSHPYYWAAFSVFGRD